METDFKFSKLRTPCKFFSTVWHVRKTVFFARSENWTKRFNKKEAKSLVPLPVFVFYLLFYIAQNVQFTATNSYGKGQHKDLSVPRISVKS